MSSKNPKVDLYFNTAQKWQDEFNQLRIILLGFDLKEELKWGCPCYTCYNNNVVLIHGFKEYCALLFFKGALLHDAEGMLIKQTENVQAARQIRFTNVQEIVEKTAMLKTYINEAINVEKAGLKVKMKKPSAYSIPDEFQHKLDEIPAFKTAFNALTPGRQRAYIYYFSQPKQSKTRESRIEKCMPQIMDGKGLNE